jgi:hypothetical protein
MDFNKPSTAFLNDSSIMTAQDSPKDSPIPPSAVWSYISQEQAAHLLRQLVHMADEISSAQEVTPSSVP